MNSERYVNVLEELSKKIEILINIRSETKEMLQAIAAKIIKEISEKIDSCESYKKKEESSSQNNTLQIIPYNGNYDFMEYAPAMLGNKQVEKI